MTEKEWDKKLRKKIETSPYTDEIWKYILADRKHQKSEMLKRLNVNNITYEIMESKIVIYAQKIGREFAKASKIKYDDPEDTWLKDKSVEIATAIHKLVKDKLK